MATYFTIESVDAPRCADREGRHESLCAALKAAERAAKVGAPPCEVVARGDVSTLWEVEAEPGVAVWQGYQFEACDGYYEHIAKSHGNDYDLPDVSHAETGLVRGINGDVIGTYAACRVCNALKIRLTAVVWSEKMDFVVEAGI